MYLKIIPMSSLCYLVIKDKSNNDLLENSSSITLNFFILMKVVKSEDEPVNALRKLKKSSMRLGINCVNSKKMSWFCFSR